MTYQKPLGTLETGKPQRGEGNTWARFDTWTANAGSDAGKPRQQFTHCLNGQDLSDTHATYPEGYEAACSCCWLGFAHTEELHRAEINR